MKFFCKNEHSKGRCMKHPAICAGLVIFMVATSAYAGNSGDFASAKIIVDQVCAACHGADGNSVIPANPKIAGQHVEYTLKQLRNFKGSDNKKPEDIRKNSVMAGMVAGLSESDMKNLAAYFSIQQPLPGTATNKELALRGQKIYRGGNTKTGVPACGSCHSPNGAGIPALYPRLAGQHAEYTLAQLKAFRLGTRANDVNEVMRAIAARLTDQEARAVAEYIAALK